ncbi:hypothetical protein G9A89_007413 [Geosiphon pyriformis]|nr:hypothetical protein G9A89_007413 [Geosiphon pyriformis]
MLIVNQSKEEIVPDKKEETTSIFQSILHSGLEKKSDVKIQSSLSLANVATASSLYSTEETFTKDQRPIDIDSPWENHEGDVIDEMDIDPLQETNQIDTESAISRDLCESIPGLYRLLDLCKDEGSNGLVDKIIISQQFVKKLCNEIVPNSFKSISKVNYKKLNSKAISLVGVYGRNEMIANFLLHQNIINHSIHGSLLNKTSQTINQGGSDEELDTLRPGIYLLRTPFRSSDSNPAKLQFLVVHWGEEGCYEDLASSHRKKNLTNMHRYLTKLTEHQICLMSERDLENINWQIFGKEFDDDEKESDEEDQSDEDICYDFEVTKRQEQKEDFELFPGFEMQLPKNMTREYIHQNEQSGNLGLDSLIVESVTNQTFLTREIVPATKKIERGIITLESESYFREYFKSKLEKQKCALFLSRQLKMRELEIIVKDGLKLNDLFTPLEDELKVLEKEKKEIKIKQKASLKEDAALVEKFGRRSLKYAYSFFESLLQEDKEKMPESGTKLGQNEGQTDGQGGFNESLSSGSSKEKIESETAADEIMAEYIKDNYPDIIPKFEEAITAINYRPWFDMKCRLTFARHIGLSSDIPSTPTNNSDRAADEPAFTVSQIFLDKEKNLFNLVKKYTRQPDETGAKAVLSFFVGGNMQYRQNIIDKVIEEAKNLGDIDFVRQKLSQEDEDIVFAFFEEYKRWRKQVFPSNLKNVIQKIDSNLNLSKLHSKIDTEFQQKEQALSKRHLERICTEVELRYPTGEKLIILNLEANSPYSYRRHFKMLREFEVVRPALLRFTIYTTQLSAEDNMQLDKDHYFIPQPRLHFFGRNLETSFELDPEAYELRHIAQLENKKFLVFLWHKSTHRLEIYFDTIQRLPKTIHDQSPLKKLNTGEHFLLAVNEPKGLIAIYNTERAVLNTYGFEQEQSSLYLHYRNIQLLHWYNDAIPEISHFFFIKNTEDICFVEKDGRAKIYNLVNDNFRPGISHFPANSKKVMSTPDGTCIVAFVKERMNISFGSHQDEIEDQNVPDECDSSTDTASEDEPIANGLEDEVLRDLAGAEPDVIGKEVDNYIAKGYIYFCENFTRDANKIVEIPLLNPSIEIFEFSMFDKRQIHLTTIDQEKGIFHSAMVKMTHAKTQYRFERQSRNKSLGQIKLEGRRPFTIHGKGTKFMRDIRIGDYLVLGQEKRQVAEILSDTLLKISPQAPQFVKFEYGVWKDFGIEQRNTVNGLIDVYSMVFTKYAINSPIGRVDQPLTLTIVLEISPENPLNLKECHKRFRKYVDKMFLKFKKDTKKPIGHLKHFNTNFTTFQAFDNFEVHANTYQLGEWMVDFFCLIPLQIAVARDNEFVPLQDGLFSLDIEKPSLDDGYGFIGSVSKAISFGWYEAIFEHYANLEVKVVSSMGEQSCGKSYLLNHCVGSTFDGSAMRCTEGVWMSLVKTDDVLYVALDFEGLASIERTPQEETFLQLLNAALSNLVLFKSQFAVSRDISTMFQRFQDGTNYFGDDPDIFQARFCIIIKDVARSDREDIVSEFQSKFSKIVDKEEEDNFITKLYRNEMSIVPWPVFNEASFYTTFKQLKVKLDGQNSKYKNARIFVEKIKVLMTKLKVCDWGSVQATLITMRTLELKKFLKDAISCGFEQKEDFEMDISADNTVSNTNPFENQSTLNTKHLMSRDDGQLIPDPEVSLVEIFHDIENDSTKLMPDAGLVLLKDGMTLTNLSSDLRSFFEEKVQPRGQIPDSQWLEELEIFVKFIIQRRIKRVQQWFARNTNRFEKEQNEIVITNYALEQEISRLSLFWNFCRLRCNDCGLLCMKASRHSDNEQDMTHDCLTDHKCHSECQFSEAHLDQTIPKCNKFAGHEGRHACEQSHACGAPCVYDGKRNCQSRCTKDIGHESNNGNEIHLCEATRHYCGSPCSLKAETQKGEYECHNTCIIPCEEVHSVHKCENEVCPIECPISNCHRRCESKEHFHDLEGSIDHFCGGEHQCVEKCEENGICKIITEPTAIVKEEAEYVNKFGSFMFTKYSQSPERLPCCIKIPPYKFKHDGKHVHEEKKEHKCSRDCPSDMGLHIKEEDKKQYNFHYCNVKCPNCGYYCISPYDHGRDCNSKHATVHGNMYLTTFTCEEEEFEFEGHRLTVGDHGDFVLCHKLCENIGRHRHIDYCKDPDVCKTHGGLKKEGILEHINAKISPSPLREKDYISHKVYWERTDFQDPYNKDQRENFKQCDHECADEKHHKIDDVTGRDPVRSFCTQDIFHAKLDHTKAPPGNTGYVTVDGHHFACENPVTNIGNFHIIFVVDRSGSMGDQDCQPRCSSTKTSRLLLSHKNRLGAVYEACYSFIETRKNSRQNTSAGQSAIDRDTVSLVLFDTGAIIPFENRSLSNSDELLRIMMQYHPSGGTCYQAGILKVADIINQYHDPTRTNIVLFLSDGESYGSHDQELRDLCNREASRGSPLFLYTVLFAADGHSGQSLKTMVDIANQYHPKGNAKDALKCQYALAVDEIKLAMHFTQVAESLRKHQPMLIKK